MPEYSDRARYVTEQVSLWIQNDGDHYDKAQHFVKSGDVVGLADYLTATLKYEFRKESGAWHTAQELAPNDYGRIRWEDVAGDLS